MADYKPSLAMNTIFTTLNLQRLALRDLQTEIRANALPSELLRVLANIEMTLTIHDRNSGVEPAGEPGFWQAVEAAGPRKEGESA